MAWHRGAGAWVCLHVLSLFPEGIDPLQVGRGGRAEQGAVAQGSLQVMGFIPEGIDPLQVGNGGAARGGEAGLQGCSWVAALRGEGSG